MGLAIRDFISPALLEKIRRIGNKRPILMAAGAALASVATRAFREPNLRPSEWPPLSAATLKRRPGGKPLIDTGTLMRSILAQDPSADSIEVGTDRTYGLYHQFGSEKRPGHPPARPFFPVKDGKLTESAEKSVRSAIEGQVSAILR